MEEHIKTMLEKHIDLIRSTDKLIRNLKLENEQEFLDWQDDINAISVK